MLTLEQYSQDYLRPAMLRLVNLPDTDEGNKILDELISILFESEHD